MTPVISLPQGQKKGLGPTGANPFKDVVTAFADQVVTWARDGRMSLRSQERNMLHTISSARLL
jgi:hypothetical protein